MNMSLVRGTLSNLSGRDVNRAFGDVLEAIAQKYRQSKIRKAKTHRYLTANMGRDFVIEPLDEKAGIFVMTSQRPGVQAGDWITIKSGSTESCYQILEIEHYGDDAPDMWMGKLALK